MAKVKGIGGIFFHCNEPKKLAAYFGPNGQEFMINSIVEDLDACLTELRAAGVDVDDRVESLEYGRFGWANCSSRRQLEMDQSGGFG